MSEICLGGREGMTDRPAFYKMVALSKKTENYGKCSHSAPKLHLIGERLEKYQFQCFQTCYNLKPKCVVNFLPRDSIRMFLFIVFIHCFLC